MPQRLKVAYTDFVGGARKREKRILWGALGAGGTASSGQCGALLQNVDFAQNFCGQLFQISVAPRSPFTIIEPR